MNKKFGFCLLLILAIVGIQTRAFSATTATAALSATVSAVSSITATVFSSPSSITLSGLFENTITSPCWTVNPPSVVTLNISNNTPNKVYIYTVHNLETYWSSASAGANGTNLTALSTGAIAGGGVTINGLINAAAVKASNYYNATTALRAWADVYNVSNTSTFANVSTTDSDWQWINDRSYTVNGALLTKSTLVNDNVSNTNLPVYIRGAWNTGKVSGTYNANLRFEIASQ